MSQKIPFLQMFAALRQWTELSNGVEGWLIASAAIDKASRSAKIAVEGAGGAGPNLIAQAEEAVCRAYGLNSVKIQAEEQIVTREEKKVDKPTSEEPKLLEDKDSQNINQNKNGVDDAFARTEAIRRADALLKDYDAVLARLRKKSAQLTQAAGENERLLLELLESSKR